MKIKLIIIPILAALLLTACSPSSDNNTTSNDNTTVNEPQTTTTANQNADINTENETFLLGLDNKSITLSDITALTLTDGTELSENELTLSSFDKDNFSSAECEGFCYLADPLGIGENGGDNADNFIYSGTVSRLGIDTDREFKRYNEGDKYGDLTVKKATVFFDAAKYNESTGKPSFDGFFYKTQHVEFEGDVTVTGNISGTYYVGVEGDDTALMIDNESHILPIAVAGVSPKDNGGFYTTRYSAELGDINGKEYFNDEYGPIIVTFPEDISKPDFDHTHSVKVKATISNITVTGDVWAVPNLSGFSYITAEVKDLEILDQ